MTRWAYGVTCVESRRRDLLPRTLASLRAAGFDRPRLFVDGCHDPRGWASEFGLDVTCRWPRVLIHGNWVMALMELFIRDPHAERFAIFQDDIACVRNLRQYLERCPYPDGPVNAERTPGYLNLYSAPSNQRLARGTGWYESNQCGKGALALVFSREAVITLLSSRHMVERPLHPTRGWRAVDGGIVDSFRRVGWKEYVHSPSLVLHTGVISSMDKAKRSTGGDADFRPYRWPEHYNQTTFPGEDFDALSLLPCSAT